jgi:predicted DNA-binding protein (MmcQ/YjbR family)
VGPKGLRARCLAPPGAVEEFAFGPETSVFKVSKKIFALSALESRPLKVSLKADPELAADLRTSYEAIVGGYHLNKRHWITVTCDGSVPDRLVEELIEDSYDLVVAGLSARARARLS